MFGTSLASLVRRCAGRQCWYIPRGPRAVVPAALDHRACDAAGWKSRAEQLHVSLCDWRSVGRSSTRGLLGAPCGGWMDAATVSADPRSHVPVLRRRSGGRDRHPGVPRRRRRAAVALPDRSIHWTERLRSLRHQSDVSLVVCTTTGRSSAAPDVQRTRFSRVVPDCPMTSTSMTISIPGAFEIG